MSSSLPPTNPERNNLSAVSRREFVATVGAGLVGLAMSGVESSSTAAAAAPQVIPPDPANPAGLKLLTSTDGVNVPPRGGAVNKFSFSWPEPSLELASLLFAFEIITFENTYAVDPATATVTTTGDRTVLTAKGFTWAGGQQKAPGSLVATIERRADGALEWSVAVKFDKNIKGIKSIIRGLPRGRLSRAVDNWQEPGESERVFEYPALMGGMATPIVLIDGKDSRVWAISAMQNEVRPARFFFWPGPDSYKVELIFEPGGWHPSGEATTHTWRIGSAANLAEAIAPHFAHIEKAWKLPKFVDRKDAPEWMKHIGLVLSLHGQHFTGYIMNDYAKQLEILKWAATKMDPHNVMVFLAGWDGRYYWDYPSFEVDPRMGGAAGFKKLFQEGQALGYRFLTMFGANIANPAWPNFSKIADAQAKDLYGTPIPSDYVDWDGDRKGDGCMTFMNLAVDSWRNYLIGRISAHIKEYNADAYFLDICGFWENNLKGDMFTGTQQIVAELARLHPHIPPVAEMMYDAQMGIFPMSHVSRYGMNRQKGYFDYVASFHHMSHPAPGRGSTGCHEAGFGRYQPVRVDQLEIPTITFGDDTFDKYRDLVETDIKRAQQRFVNHGGNT